MVSTATANINPETRSNSCQRLGAKTRAKKYLINVKLLLKIFDKNKEKICPKLQYFNID